MIILNSCYVSLPEDIARKNQRICARVKPGQVTRNEWFLCIKIPSWESYSGFFNIYKFMDLMIIPQYVQANCGWHVKQPPKKKEH